MQSLRARPALAIILVLLVLSLLTGGAYAVGRSLGYIPGIGFVQDEPLRVLAEPVSAARKGATLTVVQSVLDSEHTVIVFTVDDIPPSFKPFTGGPGDEGAQRCLEGPRLRLPDGRQLGVREGWAQASGSHIEAHYTYSAIPADVNEAVLEWSCLGNIAPGVAPENWELRLRFVPVSPQMTVVPVMEITPVAVSSSTTGGGSEMGLYLEKVIELEDGYILMGTFRQGDALPGATVTGVTGEPRIRDAAERDVPFEIPQDVGQFTAAGGVFNWAYQVPKDFLAPLMVTFDAVDVQYTTDVSFDLDTGSDPHPGQKWTLNQDLDVAGYRLHLLSATMLSNGYIFDFRTTSPVWGVSLDSPYGETGGYGNGSPGEFDAGLEWRGQPPTGRLTFKIVSLTASYPGPWTLTWAPVP